MSQSNALDLNAMQAALDHKFPDHGTVSPLHLSAYPPVPRSFSASAENHMPTPAAHQRSDANHTAHDDGQGINFLDQALAGVANVSPDIKLDNSAPGRESKVVETSKTANKPVEAAAVTKPTLDENQLAQQALVADPSLIRKALPKLEKDLGALSDGHLSMVDIDQGLDNPNLNRDDKNLLHVLKAGYTEYSQVPGPYASLRDDALGVSNGSLLVLEKSLNRSIAADPIKKSDLEWGWIRPFSSGLSGGAMVSSVFKASQKTRLIVAGATGLAAAVTYEVARSRGFQSDTETASYDQEKTQYQSFIKDFNKNLATNK